MNRLISFLRHYLTAAASCVWALTLGVFSARNRELLHTINVHFGFAEGTAPEGPALPETLIPSIAPADLVPDDVTISVREPQNADGNISPGELVVIDQLVRHFSPKTCFEIGTFDGRTTLNMAANGPADGQVYTLDLPREQGGTTGLALAHGDIKFVNKASSGARFLGTEFETRIHQLYGDSATFDFSPYAGGVDLVFVDGSHSYEYVRNDTDVALRLLRDGKGVILWHDYSSPYWKGLTTALNELHAENPRLSGMQHIEGTTLVCLVSI